ncbi:MAG: PAS domain S-box protein [Lacunisphaera sp.]|nr:PAS domain S-box protein [Lacunisphaera sp.]
MSIDRCALKAGAAAFPSPEVLLGAWAGSAALVHCRDGQGRILAANPAFARKFGRPAADWIDQPVGEFLHPEDAPAQAGVDAELSRPPHRAVRDSRWLTPQGWRWISWEEHLLPGEPTVIRAVGHDITRQRMAEEQYYKLSRAVEQSPIAMVITDADGAVQYVNAKFIEVTGYTLEMIIENNIQVLREIHADEASYTKFWETIRAGSEWRGEHVHHRPDGKKVFESVQITRLLNSAGEITNLLCLREDITGRRELEDQLRQAQKMESIGTLAGGIAHDFNNMLAVINGYAEFAQMNPGNNEVLQKCVREIKGASQRATGLVRQILTFSRKAEVRFTAVDLNLLTRDLVALLGETFPRNLRFNFKPAGDLPPLLADQNQLQQIVLNLCVNARDAMPGGGTLTLTTARIDGAAVPPNLRSGRSYACLTVSDTGTGMTPEVRTRIFEPFYTTKPVNQGTGLGLAVVYGIVASHEGTIQVDSQPAIGSTFRVYLPLADTAAPVPAFVRSGAFPAGTESILVTDDEPALRQLLGDALARAGYQISCASDGLEAIERIASSERRYDAVLLDLNMPGANGVEVYKVIKATRPGLKVLVVTGHLTLHSRAEFEQLGLKDFVMKPYTLEELGRRLREVLDAPKA